MRVTVWTFIGGVHTAHPSVNGKAAAWLGQICHNSCDLAAAWADPQLVMRRVNLLFQGSSLLGLLPLSLAVAIFVSSHINLAMTCYMADTTPVCTSKALWGWLVGEGRRSGNQDGSIGRLCLT